MDGLDDDGLNVGEGDGAVERIAVGLREGFQVGSE